MFATAQKVTGALDGGMTLIVVVFSAIAVAVIVVLGLILGYLYAAWVAFMFSLVFGFVCLGELFGERYDEATAELFLSCVCALAASTMFAESGDDYAAAAVVTVMFALGLFALAIRNIGFEYPIASS